MLDKVKYALYYLIFFNLPNGRYLRIATRLRVLYITKILRIAEYHENTRIQNKVYLSSAGKVTIGKNCQINEFTFIQGATIGDNVMIAPYVTILCNIKKFDDLDVPMNMQGWVKRNKQVIIKDNVWIGRNAVLMPGITVNTGAVIGAGSIVTKDVSPNTIVGGNPSKVIRVRNGG